MPFTSTFIVVDWIEKASNDAIVKRPVVSFETFLICISKAPLGHPNLLIVNNF